MRKFIFLFIAILTMSHGNVFSQKKEMLTEEQAIEVFKKNIPWPGQNNIEMYPTTMGKNQKIILTFGKGGIYSPDFISYVFFIDDLPNAGWGHECRYVFINAFTGDIIIKNSLSPPEEIWKGIPTGHALNL